MTTRDRTRFSIGLALALAALSAGAQAPIYRWVDADGVVHFSDAPPAASQAVEAETLIVPSSAPQVGAERPRTNTPVESFPADRTDAASQAESSAATLPAQTGDPNCSTPSPRKQAGILYVFERDSTPFPRQRAGIVYDLENDERPEPLTAEQIDAFETAIGEMAGYWSGSDVGLTCDGIDKAPTSGTVVSEGRLESSLRFALESTISARGRNRRDLLRIEVRDQRPWVNHGPATFITVSDRALEFAYAERIGGGVSERYWRIELDGRRAMTIEQETFANGALVEAGTWQLEKRF